MSINYKILTILWAVFILILSITPGNYIPPVEFKLIAPDTIAHVVFYSVLVFLHLKWKSSSNLIVIFQILIISIVYGFLIEVIQGTLILGRFYDLFDVLSNSIGSVFGLILFYILKKNIFS